MDGTPGPFGRALGFGGPSKWDIGPFWKGPQAFLGFGGPNKWDIGPGPGLKGVLKEPENGFRGPLKGL